MKKFCVRVIEPEWRAYECVVEADTEAVAVVRAMRGEGLTSTGEVVVTIDSLERYVDSVEEV